MVKANPDSITNPPPHTLARKNEGVVKAEGVPTWTVHSQNGLFTEGQLDKATLYLCEQPGRKAGQGRVGVGGVAAETVL